jgi:hypothetical protein
MPVRTSSARQKKAPHYLLLRLVGDEGRLRRFLSRYPAEIQGVSQKGETFSLRVILPDSALEAARAAGLQYVFDTDLTKLGEEQVKQVGAGNVFDPALLSLGLTLPTQVDYLDCPAVAQATIDLATAYGACCDLIVLPNQTVEGATCHAISISKMAPAGAPAILILGGIHGREWGSCEIALHFVERLLSTYQAPGNDLVLGNATFTAAQVKTLVETRQIIVFPMVNPDGRAYSQGGMDPAWRKNRNPAQQRAGDPRSIGVDINRNFDFLFKLADAFVPNCGLMVSADPSDHETYQGPEPFSEAEAKNVEYLLDTNASINWLVDLHSSSQTVMCPWTVDQTQTTVPQQSFLQPGTNQTRGVAGDAYAEFMRKQDFDEHVRLRDILASGIVAAGGPQYALKTGFDFGACSGTSHDYAYARHLISPDLPKVLGFVVEWGTLPYPDWVDMQKILVEVSAGLVNFSIATQHPLP